MHVHNDVSIYNEYPINKILRSATPLFFGGRFPRDSVSLDGYRGRRLAYLHENVSYNEPIVLKDLGFCAFIGFLVLILNHVVYTYVIKPF